MKKLITLILTGLILACLGCSVNHYYFKSKPFKPDKYNKVRECKTYTDVNKSAKHYYKADKRK